MKRIPIAAGVAVVLALAACTPPPSAPPAPNGTPSAGGGEGVQPVGDPRDVATGLQAPWSIARLGDGTVLVSERDAARIVRIDDDGSPRPVRDVPGVVPGGEGGLLGIAPLENDGERWLYVYFTAASDNRIARMPLSGDGAELKLGDPEVVLSGIPKAGNHNGGRIAFGPDGMLYATTGDAGEPDRAQDREALAGKILRMTPTGDAPEDNPFEGSLTYSFGHRNPQGLAWDDDGQIWASEFGQNTWDELNRIEAGGNYGWPAVEGIAGDSGYVDPVAQWSPGEASPSGLTYIGGTFFMAALRGERVWAIYPTTLGQDWSEVEEASAEAWFAGDFGRIRAVAAGPDGTLWFLTNNTDGRGDPREGDDRLVEVDLGELTEG